jgi:hypothetical protein
MLLQVKSKLFLRATPPKVEKYRRHCLPLLAALETDETKGALEWSQFVFEEISKDSLLQKQYGRRKIAKFFRKHYPRGTSVKTEES